MPGMRVTLYGRPGCGLCDEAEADLQALRSRFGLTIERVNIEDDDELLRRYVFEIPVVTVDGVEVARAPIYRGGLEKALERARTR